MRTLLRNSFESCNWGATPEPATSVLMLLSTALILPALQRIRSGTRTNKELRHGC
jgi:hypothetical protein